MEPKRKLPIGIDDFRRVIEDGYAYVDKSLLIRELLDRGSQVVLVPRPRRFGKTLNLSMLRYFFEAGDEATSRLFQELAIWRQGDDYRRHQGAYPVIFLTLKDVKCERWADCEALLRRSIAEEYRRHSYLLDTDALDVDQKAEYRAVMRGSADNAATQESLKTLSVHLHRFHGVRVFILIDEYDAPIHAGFVHEYYADVTAWLRHWLGAALKGNPALEKGVLTGILRVAKESIFSGLNNLDVCTLLSRRYSDSFGLLDHEVQTLLQAYGIAQDLKTVREWYNGYRFGERVVYNPWSILMFVNNWPDPPRPHWVNTSDNALVRQLLTRNASGVQVELDRLLRREVVEKPVDDHIVFGDLDRNPDALWSFLLFSGYLKAVEQEQRNKRTYCRLQIPNLEVEFLYEEIIRGWLQTPLPDAGEPMLAALLAGDVETFARAFERIVLSAFSYLDAAGREPEVVYHAFTLGLLVALRETHDVKSNRESGLGRYDVMLIPHDAAQRGVVIEFKRADRPDQESLRAAASAALRQIDERGYAAELRERGVQEVTQLGIAFCGKAVSVLGERK